MKYGLFLLKITHITYYTFFAVSLFVRNDKDVNDVP